MSFYILIVLKKAICMLCYIVLEPFYFNSFMLNKLLFSPLS